MLPRVGPTERAAGAARLQLQLSDPGSRPRSPPYPASAGATPGLMFDRLRWRRENGQRRRRARDPAHPPDELRRPGALVAEQQRAIRDALGRARVQARLPPRQRHRPEGGIPFAEAEWLAGWLALRFTDQPKLAARAFRADLAGGGDPDQPGRAGLLVGPGRRRGAGEPTAAAAWYARAAYPTASTASSPPARSGATRRPRAGRRAASPAASDALRSARRRQLASLFCRAGQPRYAQPFFRHLGSRGGGRSGRARGGGRARARLRPRRPRPDATRAAPATAPSCARGLSRCRACRGSGAARRHARAGAGAGRGAAGEPVRPGRRAARPGRWA